MSKEAIMIDQQNNRVLVNIDTLSPAEYENRFICPGILDDGTTCGILTRPAEGVVVRGAYFYPARRDQPHRPGCPCARARKTTIVESLDRRGAGKTNWELFESLNREKSIHSKKEKSKTQKFEADPNYDSYSEHTEMGNDCKDIQTKKRMPRKTEEYARLLMTLSIHDNYMDGKVFDFLLDERTIESYRRMGIPCGKPFLAMCRRTLPYKHEISIENNQWVLVDYWAIGKNARYPIVFVLNVDSEAKSKLLNLCRIEPSVKIAVYAVFQKHPTLQRAYISEPIKAQMITAFMDDQCL